VPRGPKGEKRPADAIDDAIVIAKIATGEIEDITTEDGRTPLRWRSGAWAARRGLRACWPNGAREIAKKAAAKRWSPK
jgi:hypothetical protein